MMTITFKSYISESFGKRNSPGMILVFVLLVMLLLSLMGVVILTNSRVELTTTSTNRLSNQAFNSADTSAQVAILLTRILLHPELGPPDDVIKVPPDTNMNFPFEVKIHERFNLATIKGESNVFDYRKRYVGTKLSPSDELGDPHLSFKIKDTVVANAIVALDPGGLITSGDTIDGGDAYSTSMGNIQVNAIISVNGTSAVSDLENIEAPNTVITTIYREFM